MEENRKKEKRKILPKRRNYVFVIFRVKNLRKRVVKKVFFTNIFVNWKRNNKESKHNESRRSEEKK